MGREEGGGVDLQLYSLLRSSPPRPIGPLIGESGEGGTYSSILCRGAVHLVPLDLPVILPDLLPDHHAAGLRLVSRGGKRRAVLRPRGSQFQIFISELWILNLKSSAPVTATRGHLLKKTC